MRTNMSRRMVVGLGTAGLGQAGSSPCLSCSVTFATFALLLLFLLTFLAMLHFLRNRKLTTVVYWNDEPHLETGVREPLDSVLNKFFFWNSVTHLHCLQTTISHISFGNQFKLGNFFFPSLTENGPPLTLARGFFGSLSA